MLTPEGHLPIGPRPAVSSSEIDRRVDGGKPAASKAYMSVCWVLLEVFLCLSFRNFKELLPAVSAMLSEPPSDVSPLCTLHAEQYLSDSSANMVRYQIQDMLIGSRTGKGVLSLPCDTSALIAIVQLLQS